MQESTFHSVHRLPSDEWEPPSADALSLAYDLACATRALVAPFLARACAGLSTTASDHWQTEPVHYASPFSTLRDATWLGTGTDNSAASVRSRSPQAFIERARADGCITVPFPGSAQPRHATQHTTLGRGASRRGISADGFTLSLQALLPKMLQRRM